VWRIAGCCSLLRPHDQRVVVNSASYSQAGYLILDANHLHLAPKLDIAVTLVEALARYREDALETVTQFDGPTDETVKPSAAQILSFTLEGLGRTHLIETQRAAQQHPRATATIHGALCHERRCFMFGKPGPHWYQNSSIGMQIDSQRLKFPLTIYFVKLAKFPFFSKSQRIGFKVKILERIAGWVYALV
jgi:hypothetical protein